VGPKIVTKSFGAFKHKLDRTLCSRPQTHLRLLPDANFAPRHRLIGRIDPKLERKSGLLRIKALHLEPGIAPDEKMTADVAAAHA
jgi:hypothetical protein